LGKYENITKEQQSKERVFNQAICFERWFYGRLAYTFTNLTKGDRRPATPFEKDGAFLVAEMRLAFFKRFDFIPKAVTDHIREVIDKERKNQRENKTVIGRLWSNVKT